MGRILATSEANEEQIEEERFIGIDALGGRELDREETEKSILSSTDERSLLKQVSETSVAVNSGEVEGTTYLVEQLLDSKLIRKKRHYLVKWRGFDDPTWEPHDNIPSHIKRNFNKEKK